MQLEAKYTMKSTFRWYKLLLLISFLYKVTASPEWKRAYDSPNPTFEFRNFPVGQACVDRRQLGFCKSLENCRYPTRSTCGFGPNPIVCCLDDPSSEHTTTTITPIATFKPKNIEARSKPTGTIDLTFPNCGLRSPKVAESNSGSRSGWFGGGLFGRKKRGLSPGTGSGFSLSGLLSKFLPSDGNNANPVIVGGVTATANSWPWMVAIFKEFPGGRKSFLCGSSLISKRYVLTAAHCFDDEKGNIVPSKFSVRAGAHTTKDGTVYPVEDITIHENYKIGQYYNDIALLKVGEEVVLGKKVYPICLPSDRLTETITPGETTVTVTGWGATSFGGKGSMTLQQVSVPTVPLKECNESYWKVARSKFPNGITNLFICAGLQKGGKDACQGDSGGPMITKLKDDSYVQQGVVSFGYGCAEAGFPGVYTRLSQYTEWLYDNTDLGRS